LIFSLGEEDAGRIAQSLTALEERWRPSKAPAASTTMAILVPLLWD